ncbi:MAG TPA: VOC family protein [Candidatus Dormibacteraeota bacterium]
MAKPVVHFEVVGRDAEALQHFYSAVFGWDMQQVMPGYALVHAGAEGGIDGGVGGDPGGGAGRVTFYVQVEDLEGTLDEVKKLGGKTAMEPDEVPNGPRLALFEDPEGHLIGLTTATASPA